MIIIELGRTAVYDVQCIIFEPGWTVVYDV